MSVCKTLKPQAMKKTNITVDVKYAMRIAGSEGGKAAARRMSAEERVERARNAGRARWDKAKMKTPIQPI